VQEHEGRKPGAAEIAVEEQHSKSTAGRFPGGEEKDRAGPRRPRHFLLATRFPVLATFPRSMADAKLTPMMQQYFEVKRGLPRDTLLLFRLGDFFEMFFDDAVTASRLLGLTLTRRQEHPMAGIPAHACDTYVSKLLAAGKKVAICDQAEPAKAGKLVRRQLTRILSPGTTLAANQLDAARNHYLAAVALDKHGLHAAWLDLSTGEFKIATDPHIANLLPVLTALDPAELLVIEGERERWVAAPHEQTEIHALHAFCATRLVSELPGYHFDTATGAKTVMDALGVLNLQGFGLAPSHPALGPAGALVYYATENLCAKPENLRGLQEYRSARTLLLDPATLRNLEIFSSSRGTRDGSLLHAINRTVTSTGVRLLERWLAAPTLELAEIQRRQALVGELLAQPTRLAELHELLGRVRDIPRILGRLQNRLRNPRELGGIRDTLAQIPALKSAVAGFGATARLSALNAQLHELPALRDLVGSALADELPNDLADGNYIRAGHDPELDRMRSLTTDNKTWLSDLERGEQERTGIRSLKVRFTNNFGYYIEITKANLRLVPADYIRRQTTVGGERYVTEALRQKEKEIFHAEENALAREQELFGQLVAAVLDESIALTQTAEALAELDVLAGWALLARDWDYCRPTLDDGDALEVSEGRHPVVEQMLRAPDAPVARGGSAAFVPNDTALACDDAQLALITGPNMAGKSTYIRQVALIALMAQVGCWVPAKTCRLGLVDRIFSRVGASDDLARGNSTFMVEMNETANILNNATDRSLIILDEIGRGTSTYDGLAIAWAVVEHLHRSPERGPRTLFATHYQELTQLEKHLPRLRNFSVAVKEWNDEIVFVRRVIPGAADRSYGIQVARLAGLPLSVIDRAKTILAKLESDDTTVSLPAPQAKPKKKITVAPPDDSQLNLL
jgi:DNA mismatch repair protein MutS